MPREYYVTRSRVYVTEMPDGARISTTSPDVLRILLEGGARLAD